MMRAAMILIATVTILSPLSAQSVQGRLLAAPSQEPLAGALVALLDSAGTEVARAATTPSGGFALSAPRAGKYQVVVRQIGQLVWRSAPFTLAAGADYPLILRVAPRPHVLPPITVAARRTRCGVSLDDDDLLGRLLDAASTALGIAEESADAGTYRFTTDTYLKRLGADLAVVESTDTDLPGLARWPIESADPDSLRVWGFVRTPPGTDAGPVYYGPDARVLFSDWFLDSHCFEVESAGETAVEVRFEPERRGRRVDLEGRLAIDRESLELRTLAFEYVGLPRWVPRDKAGGEVELRRLGAGAWVPTTWHLRAPLPGRSTRTSRITIRGWVETGGRVTAVRTPEGGVDSVLTEELMSARSCE